VHYEWVKGHADDLNRYLTKLERMNIVADELCDVMRETARGPFGARPNCGLLPSERFALFIRGKRATMNNEVPTPESATAAVAAAATVTLQNIVWEEFSTPMVNNSSTAVYEPCANSNFTMVWVGILNISSEH
jgi:hypothetical protein